MKLLYVAGPFRDHNTGPGGRYNFWKQDQNCNDAAKVAGPLWKMGASVICPHLNTRPFQGYADDELWLQGDLEQVRRSDAMVLVPGWEASHGTQTEVMRAREWQVRVFEWDHSLQDARELLSDGTYGPLFVSSFIKGFQFNPPLNSRLWPIEQ